MKLAEALQERADLNKKIESLRYRLENNATVQEGEKSSEDIYSLLDELNQSTDRLAELIAKINLTNCKTIVDGLTLTELIAKKDVLMVKVAIYRNLVNEASNISRRARGSEIKILPNLSVVDLQKEADLLSKEIRIIDNKIQSTNWQIDLMNE